MNVGEEKTDLAEWLKMVEQLQHSPDWPADELPIEMKQTHISVLLLGSKHVVKLKKPVDFGFLDYTTPQKRRQACEDEVNLNRRLCLDTYIGYSGVIESNGKIGFSGQHGRVVDYCVWMNRLPEDRMLDRMVAENTVTEAILDRIAAQLSAFHQNARRGPQINQWGSLAEICHNWEENFIQTEAFINRTISASDFNAIQDWVNDWLTHKTDLFARRIHDKRIVDGHGDVRCESICVMDDAIRIYDCIEFNERFRCDDVASEIAFLAMDLDARARPDLGYYFTEAYQQRANDNDLFTLLPFYRCYRAYVRGKVLSFRLNEPEFSDAEKETAAQQARNYFELARRYATPLQKPTVIAVCGLSGTGKTSVARAIASELGLRVISADAVRQSLFGDAKKPSGYGEGAYTTEASRRTYQKMLTTGQEFLAANRGVILDATFQRAADRNSARQMAMNAGADWRIIECTLAPEFVQQRLEQRAARGDGLSDANWEIYLRQRETFEDIRPEIEKTAFTLNTNDQLAQVAHRATDWLRQQELISKPNLQLLIANGK
ncbi:MAG: AAA family ATPase [Acidobacteria bacterium]|nr:AAA family ATPase [Acidobacteriota bacterium]